MQRLPLSQFINILKHQPLILPPATQVHVTALTLSATPFGDIHGQIEAVAHTGDTARHLSAPIHLNLNLARPRQPFYLTPESSAQLIQAIIDPLTP